MGLSTSSCCCSEAPDDSQMPSINAVIEESKQANAKLKSQMQMVNRAAYDEDDGSTQEFGKGSIVELPAKAAQKVRVQTQPPAEPKDHEQSGQDFSSKALESAEASVKVAASTPKQLFDDVIEVAILNTTGKRLGFGVAYKPGNSNVHVVSLLDKGLLPEWNAVHPDQRVEVGYKLLSVNDLRIDPMGREIDTLKRTIIDACSTPDIKLRFQKWPVGP